MKFDLRRPCDNCPFRTDINFPLERARVEEIVDSITRQDRTFACHKTTKHCPETGEHIPSKKEQHCAGGGELARRFLAGLAVEAAPGIGGRAKPGW